MHWGACPWRWLPRQLPTCPGSDARPRHCQVRIERRHDLRLQVRDDGADMPDGWRAGVGITAMRERVAQLGGELAIDRAGPRGTCVTVCLPVRRP